MELIKLKMDVDNENIEPETDLGLALGYSNQCIQRILHSDSGAGANAGSRIHMTFVAAEPLSELVWSKDKGPSNVTLSPPQSNTGGRSSTDKPIDEENFVTPQTSSHLKSEAACKDMTMSPTSDAGIMPACGSSREHETGTGGNVEDVKAAVEVSVPYNQGGICTPVNFQVDEIPETREKDFPTLSGNVDREGADILLIESDQILPFGEQNEPLLGDPVGGDRHADVGNQKMEMDLVSTSEVHPVNESKASGAPVENQRPQGRRPLEKMEVTAENDLQNLKSEHAYGAESQILGLESSPGVKDRFEQDVEMLPGNKSVLVKETPTNSKIQKYRRKGKEKALSDGDLNGRMSEDEDDSHESVESCNSAALFSLGKKRWNFEDEFIVGSKRFRKQIQETPTCISYIRQDSSFMNWMSSMVKGFSKSMQDEAPSLALTLAHPDHGHAHSDKKLITCNKNQNAGLKNIGFHSIFQSLYCPKAEQQEARMLNDNHQIGEISAELESNTTPKAFHGEKINLSGVLLSVGKFKKSSSGNEVRSAARSKSSSEKAAGIQEKGNTNSAEEKNPCNFWFHKKKDRASSNSSLGKRKKKSVEDVESSPQSEGKTTDKFGRRSALLESLWITRFTQKTPAPSSILNRYIQGTDGVLECSDDHKNVGNKEQSAEDLVIVIGNDPQNCAADNEGSSAFNNKGQNDQKSVSKFNPIFPSPKFRGSEAMASSFARRLDALKHITPSGATGNAAYGNMTCFFCGRKGHHLRECSEIKDTELQELLSKCKSYIGAEHLPSFCIRCSQCSHWAVACPNAPSMGESQLDCNVSCLDYYCSQSETKPNSRNDMKLLTGKESEFQASVAHTLFDEDDSRIEADLNLSWKTNKMIVSKKMRSHPNSIKEYSSSSPGENKLMPLAKFVNAQISDVPKVIFDSVRRLRLSRTDVVKWMNSHTSLSQLEGFFLRLRLGKWEEGLGGTGYYVSCITGSQRETCPQNVDSIAVVVGGIKCLVKSQYVSNQDFLEDELKAWWSATSKGYGKLPSEEDLREQVKRKTMLGL